MSGKYKFFHWHLAFPDIFEVKPTKLADDDVAGWIGGFDIVLGNPPWEKINLKDEEFFASSYPEIANAANKNTRKNLIEKLKETDAFTYHLYYETQSEHDRISQFFRTSGRFPVTGVSRINLYSVFAELAQQNVEACGRVGLLLASGIATDDNNKVLFGNLVKKKQLVSIWDFENKEGIFPGVHRSYKFCAFCSTGKEGHQKEAEFAFYLTNVQQLRDEQRLFTLSHNDLVAVNPTTKTAPTFRNKREAEITKGIYQRIQAWCLHDQKEDCPGNPKTPFNMSNDSGLFHSYSELIKNGASFGQANLAYIGRQQFLPLYESKFIHQFNHRYAIVEKSSDQVIDASLSQLSSPNHAINPQYWMDAENLEGRYPGNWFLVYRMIARATDEKTGIATIIPSRPCSNSLTIIDSISTYNAIISCTNMNSFVHDYVARQKVPGTNFNHWIWKQLPVPLYAQVNHICRRIDDDQAILWLVYRFLELCYVAYDLRPFSQDCGYHGPPFRWDEARRFLLRCELDAYYFHLYGIARDDVDYIMETFPIVKRKDIAAHGEYRTKRVILEIYDEMAIAMRSGQPYQTRLDPPPAAPATAHPWDEQYLGVYQEPSTWWREVASSAEDEDGEITYTTSTTASRVTLRESRPAYTIAPVTTTVATQLGLGFAPKVWSAPIGNLQERQERVIALAVPANGSTSEDNLRELTAFLADPQASVRTLATQVLRQQSSSLLVSILDDFYSEAESSRVANAKPEIRQLLQSMVETAKEKETQGAAQKLLVRITI